MYEYRVVFQGHGEKDRATRTYILTAPDAATAEIAAGNILAELVDASGAVVRSERLTSLVSDDDNRPAFGVDAFKNALINVHLNAPADAEKLAQIYIPAPPSAFFLSDGVTVDINNADLQALVAVLASNTTLSDGESINTSSGVNGIKSGHMVVKPKNFKA